jgi:hypothetical protein
MSTLTANTPASSAWSLFADWARRTLDRLPSYFAEVDPAMLRHMPPF